jgi:hypothetical protein
MDNYRSAWHYCNARDAIQLKMDRVFQAEIRQSGPLQAIAEVDLRFIEFRDMGEAILE